MELSTTEQKDKKNVRRLEESIIQYNFAEKESAESPWSRRSAGYSGLKSANEPSLEHMVTMKMHRWRQIYDGFKQ